MGQLEVVRILPNENIRDPNLLTHIREFEQCKCDTTDSSVAYVHGHNRQVCHTYSRFQPKKVSFFTLFWAHRNTQKLKNQQETF